jgi:hypothetical protein
MIEVVLNVQPNRTVLFYGFEWPTVEEDGFSPEGAEELERTLGELLGELDVGEAVSTKILTISNYLFDNYYVYSSRVVILHDLVEFSRIEYNVIDNLPVGEPEPKLVNRVSRYDREPVI